MSREPLHNDDADNDTLCTWLAGWLSLGGCLWGLLLLPIILTTFDRPEVASAVVLVFAPGYVLTAGYVVRFCNIAKSRGARLQLWVWSAVIQGAWLLFGLYGGAGPILCSWWMFATCGSFVGLLVDRSTPATQLPMKAADLVPSSKAEPRNTQRLRFAE